MIKAKYLELMEGFPQGHTIKTSRLFEFGSEVSTASTETLVKEERQQPLGFPDRFTSQITHPIVVK